jgi:hypothetical protein
MSSIFRNLWLAVFATMLSQQAIALPTATISDDYIGSDSHGHGDVIGSVNNFQINHMDVTLTGTMLSISVNTTFAGKGDNGLFAPYTTGTTAGEGKGIGYGDIFLSSSWSPVGTAPYYGDDAGAAGTTLWTYGFSLDNRWWDGVDASGGTGTLYALTGATNNDNALLSEDFVSGATFRNGQEVAVDTSATDGTGSPVAVTAGSGTWSILSDSVVFNIDLAGTTLLSGSEIALHWGFTCANDVIEGAYSVAEPGMLLLLATGLIGFGATATKRKNS